VSGRQVFHPEPAQLHPGPVDDLIALRENVNILTEFKVKRGRESELIALLRELLPKSRRHAAKVTEEISHPPESR
jgi:hypothetical protein